MMKRGNKIEKKNGRCLHRSGLALIGWMSRRWKVQMLTMAWRNARGSQMVLVGAPGATMDCETLHVTIVHKTTHTLNIMCWRTACSDGWTCIMRIQATPNHLTDDKTYTRLSQKKKHNNEPTWILSADKVKYYWAACIKRGGGDRLYAVWYQSRTHSRWPAKIVRSCAEDVNEELIDGPTTECAFL